MKDKSVLVRVSEEEKAMIERLASTEGLSVSAYLRRLSLNDAKDKGFK